MFKEQVIMSCVESHFRCIFFAFVQQMVDTVITRDDEEATCRCSMGDGAHTLYCLQRSLFIAVQSLLLCELLGVDSRGISLLRK